VLPASVPCVARLASFLPPPRPWTIGEAAAVGEESTSKLRSVDENALV